MGIDRSDLVPNAGQCIRACIRPYHDGHAARRRPRKLTPRQRQEDYGLADRVSILQVADYAYDFIRLLAVLEALSDHIPVAEEFVRGTLIEHHGQGNRLRSVGLDSLI